MLSSYRFFPYSWCLLFLFKDAWELYASCSHHITDHEPLGWPPVTDAAATAFSSRTTVKPSFLPAATPSRWPALPRHTATPQSTRHASVFFKAQYWRCPWGSYWKYHAGNSKSVEVGDGSISVCFLNVLTFMVIPLLLPQFDFNLDNLKIIPFFLSLFMYVYYFSMTRPYTNFLEGAYVFTSIC